jgi:rubredoxin
MKPEHVCVVCGHVHDEATEGVWEDLAEDFLCPECGCGKDEYEAMYNLSKVIDN